MIRAADHLPSHCALINLLANCIICPHRPTNYRGIRPSRIIVRKCWIEDYWNRTNKVIFWSNWTFVFIQIMISAWIIEDCWWMVHCTILPAAIAADGISQNCATHEIGFCASVSPSESWKMICERGMLCFCYQPSHHPLTPHFALLYKATVAALQLSNTYKPGIH